MDKNKEKSINEKTLSQKIDKIKLMAQDNDTAKLMAKKLKDYIKNN